VLVAKKYNKLFQFGTVKNYILTWGEGRQLFDNYLRIFKRKSELGMGEVLQEFGGC
jgi:hypothetical protein